jgi:hypothetical protein
MSDAMSTAELRALAGRLSSRGTSPSLVQQISDLQSDAWLAARVIRALLRHVNPSDTFDVLATFWRKMHIFG